MIQRDSFSYVILIEQNYHIPSICLTLGLLDVIMGARSGRIKDSKSWFLFSKKYKLYCFEGEKYAIETLMQQNRNILSNFFIEAQTNR